MRLDILLSNEAATGKRNIRNLRLRISKNLQNFSCCKSQSQGLDKKKQFGSKISCIYNHLQFKLRQLQAMDNKFTIPPQLYPRISDFLFKLCSGTMFGLLYGAYIGGKEAVQVAKGQMTKTDTQITLEEVIDSMKLNNIPYDYTIRLEDD
jgi:hypothetical protein